MNKTPEKEARIKCIEKENVCVEEARRESIKENENLDYVEVYLVLIG